MDPAAKLTAFLEARGLTRNDKGRPLWRYRMSPEDFEDLKRFLREMSRKELGTTAGSALFCLYAAEWFRVELQGNNWNLWAPLLEGIGFGGLEVKRRSEVIERGLDRWGIEINRGEGRTAYLGTIVCQGGLPLRLVRSEKKHLRSYFEALLDDARALQGAPLRLELAAQHHAKRLPTTWQHPTVYKMSAELVATIHELRQVVAGADDVVSELDRREPDWRARLPVRVDDDAARDLVNGLVRAADAIAKRTSTTVSVRMQAVEVEGRYRFERYLQVPSRMPENDLSFLLGIPPARMPERLNLYASVGDDQIPVGMATRRGLGSQATFVIEAEDRILLPEASLSSRVTLRAMSGPQTWGPCELPGGKGPAELPWVFVQTDSGLRLVAEGGASVRQGHALVAFPKTARLEAGDATVVELDSDRRRLVRLEGEARIAHDDWTCRVRTASPTEDAELFRWLGQTSPVEAGIFAGPPSLVCGSVRVADLEWRPRGVKGGWRRWTVPPVGEVDVRWIHEGDCRFLDGIRVLPDAARVEIDPAKGNGGKVRLTEFGPGVEVLPRVDPASPVRREGDGVGFELPTVSAPPSLLPIEIRWPSGGHLQLSMPYPVYGGRFIARSGEPLRQGATIRVDKLSGVTAQGLGPGAFVLDVALEGAGSDRHYLKTHFQVPPRTPNASELDLTVIEEAVRLRFSMSRNLDAFARLRLEGAPGPRPELLVKRYDLSFVVDFERRTVRLQDGAEADPSKIRLEIRSLLAPGEGAVTEPLRTEGGGWSLPPLSPGPYWILGWDRGWCRARPHLLVEPGDVDATPGSLAAAICARHRDGPLSQVLQSLVYEDEHRDWQLVRHLSELLDHVPAAALDFFVKLAHHPDTAALALLRGAADGVQFDRLWRGLEQLPFSWLLIPPASWKRALDAWLRPIESAVEPVGPLIENAYWEQLSFLEDRFEERAIPGLPLICAWLRKRKRPELPSPLDSLEDRNLQRFLLEQLKGSAQSVVRSERWFPSLAPREALEDRVGPLPEALAALFVSATAASHKAGVLDAPIVAAIASARCVKLSEQTIFELKSAQDFDQKWFADAFGWAFSLAFHHSLRHHPESFS